MSLVPWSERINDPGGAAHPDAQLFIYEVDSVGEVALYADSEGATLLTQPLLSDSEGRFTRDSAANQFAELYVESGIYDEVVVADTVYPRVRVNIPNRGDDGDSPPGYDLILGIGQSNMVGVGLPIDPTVDVPNPNIWQWDWHTNAIVADSYGGASSPVYNLDRPPGGGVGLLPAFAQRYLLFYPRRPVLLVPCAHGDTSLLPVSAYAGATEPNWDPADATAAFAGLTSNLFQNAIDQTEAALTAAGPGSRLVAVIWSQGEADASAHVVQADYHTAFLALIDGLRAALDTVPFLIGSMIPESMDPDDPGYNGTQGPYRIGIDAAQQQAQADRTLVSYVRGPHGYSQDYPPIHQHYSAVGQRIRGVDLFDLLPYAKVNRQGRGVPLAPASRSIAQNVADLVISWTKPLSRVTDYIVRWKDHSTSTWTEVDTGAVLTTLTLTSVVTGGHSYDAAVKAVNEDGESDWTATVTVQTEAAPGQVVGLGTVAQQGAVALSWTTLANADDYKVEYKATSSGTWLTAAINVATTSYTVGSLTPGTSYDFRVSGRNMGGYGTVSSTATQTPLAYANLLDITDMPAAARAYSTRLLRSAFAGSAIRVVYKDATEADIGFSSGTLDTTTLLAGATTHAVTGDKTTTIKTWYDQSGNGKDVTQATGTKQPIIVASGGTLNAAPNGKAWAPFDGTNDILIDATATGSTVNSTEGASVLMVASKASDGSVIRDAYAFGNSASVSPRYTLHAELTSNAGKWYNQIKTDANVARLSVVTASLAPWDNAIHQTSAIDTDAVVRKIIDGATASEEDRTYTRVGTDVYTINRFSIGGLTATTEREFWNGKVAELVIWSVALTDDSRYAAEQSQKTYWSTP